MKFYLKDTKTASAIRKSADQGLETLNKQLEHYQKLLNHLMAFNSSSRSIFNNIEDITNKMNTGMQQFKSGYAKESIVFTIPSAEKLSWTKSINKQYL